MTAHDDTTGVQSDAERVRDAFERLADVPESNRRAAAANELPSRPDLVADLVALLEADSNPETSRSVDSLRDILRSAYDGSMKSDPFDLSGVTIGKYTIVRPLGKGAFGAVYLAEQRRPIVRQVAIKLLHPGVGSTRSLQRFALEREVLSKLIHPGIARILDAGKTSDGRPYLVMDPIDGPSIVEHVGQKDAAVSECVKLILGVVDAIAYAHGKGVLHRDLKPSNVMILDPGGTPKPVVIDFGVASWVDPQRMTKLTTDGEQIGTQDFMSPEQKAGQATDVRTDIYQLGHILQSVLEVSGQAEMPKELHWIIERCTEEDPAQRYPTAQALSEELTRWLGGLPVKAGHHRGWYVLRKFTKRHRLELIAALIVLSVIGVIAGVAIDRGFEAARQRDLLRASAIQLVDEVLPQIKELSGANTAREKLTAAVSASINELLVANPNDPELLLRHALILEEQGDRAMSSGEIESSKRFFDSAMAIMNQLSDRTENEIARKRHVRRLTIRLGDADGHLAIIASKKELLDQKVHLNTAAERAYKVAHRMILDAIEQDPANIEDLDDLSWSFERLAHKRFSLGDIDGAITLAESRLVHSQELLKKYPQNTLRLYDTACAYNILSDFYTSVSPRRALDLAENCVEISNDLIKLDHDRYVYQTMVARASISYMIALYGMDRIQEGDAEALRALELSQQLVLNNREREDTKNRLRAVSFQVYKQWLKLGRKDDAERILNETTAFLDSV